MICNCENSSLVKSKGISYTLSKLTLRFSTSSTIFCIASVLTLGVASIFISAILLPKVLKISILPLATFLSAYTSPITCASIPVKSFLKKAFNPNE